MLRELPGERRQAITPDGAPKHGASEPGTSTYTVTSGFQRQTLPGEPERTRGKTLFFFLADQNTVFVCLFACLFATTQVGP